MTKHCFESTKEPRSYIEDQTEGVTRHHAYISDAVLEFFARDAVRES